jgi:2-polyprenyl-6-methoxyphenol hydroxylase-like FAD-dependent oxidoreductase
MNNTITIAGGGIAGLTTAIALRKIGITAHVFEASDHIRPVGAGIGLGSNALKAFKAIDLDEDIARAGKSMPGFSILDEKGKTITETRFDTQSKPGNLAIHRANLHAVLLSKLDPETIHIGKKLRNVRQTSDGIQLTFENGSEITTPYLIAADGIHSLVRQKLLSNTAPRYAGYTCWRGVTDYPVSESGGSSETWGRNGRFGIVPLPENQVYWFACINAGYNDIRFKKFGISDLLDHFKNYHSPIPEILLQSRPENLIHNDIIDLKPVEHYAFGRIVLIGDAAHATTPNMAQGACQAIEDAVTLAKCMHREPDYEAAFRNFEQQRLRRTHWITQTSWKIGKIAQLENAIFIRLRNSGFRMIPESLGRRQLEKLENVTF